MVYLIVVVAALFRFTPHPVDFSPVYAALLFGGAFLSKRDRLWFPLATIAVSDVLLTTIFFHMRFVWADTLNWVAFAAVSVIGMALRNRISVRNVLIAALAGSTAFFILSNLGVWATGLMYPHDLAGLSACFVAALPFYGSTIAGGVLYSGVLFGGYEYYRRRAGEAALHRPVAR